ncbi:MAG: aryl-sulfate sulfotransferase, partial [Deltaproteobacteria bacterium]|nr:aryl-sulfate sulfotransferase [Deltaproteobacteria bacterium]
GLPGAGHFLIFDNGCYNPRGFQSVVLEINPFLDADGKDTGNYINPPDAGYNLNNTSNQIVWSYKASRPSSFYSNFISGCQRLPNGNTLIDSGATGHFFEVTEDGEIVWEYINPVKGGDDPVFTIQRDSDDRGFSVFRCYRYGPDYPGLAGRDLRPMGPITKITAELPKIPAGKGKKGKGGKGGKGGAPPEGGTYEQAASKIEDLVGIWEAQMDGAPAYMEFKADGTLALASTVEGLKSSSTFYTGDFSFDGTTFNMTESLSGSPGSYEIMVEIKEGKASKLTFTVVDDSVSERVQDYSTGMIRVEP